MSFGTTQLRIDTGPGPLVVLGGEKASTQATSKLDADKSNEYKRWRVYLMQ